MANTGKIIGAIASAVTVAAATYFGFYYKFEDGFTGWQKLTKKKPGEKKDDDTTSGGGAITTTMPKDQLPQGQFPILNGNKNLLVVRLQKSLKSEKWKQTQVKVDGNFGTKTATALKAIGYGDSVKDHDTLVKIETGVKPIVASTSTYGVLEAGKTAYAKVAGHKAAYDLTKGANSYLDTPKDMIVGTIKRLVGDTVYVQTFAGQYSLDKKFVYTM